MLASITPLGERARNRSWGVTATAYVVGSLAGGASVGAGLGLVGSLVPGLARSQVVALALASAACLAGAAADLGLAGLRLPTVSRQVNEDWLGRYRGWVCGVGFGFQLGAGVVTIVTTATVYVVLLLALLSGSARAGLLIGLTFGLARALPVLGMGRSETPEGLRRAHRRMQGWSALARRGAVLTLVAAGGAGLATAVTA